MDPLAGLDDVPWTGLYGCYGPATGLPALLRALRDGGPDERRGAYDELSGEVYHQGTRWPVSAHVVPFLAALVDAAATPDRARLVALLAAVALGDRRDDDLPFDVAAAYPEAEHWTAEGERRLIHRLYHAEDDPDEDEDWDWDNSTADRWARDAYLAAAARAGSVAGWVGDPDGEVAARAAALLAWFPPAPRSLEALLAAPGGAARASANLALGHLLVHDARVDVRLRALLTAPDARVALTAAIALARRHGERTPDRALTLLAEAADHARPLPPDVPGWGGRALRGHVAQALARVGW